MTLHPALHITDNYDPYPGRTGRDINPPSCPSGSTGISTPWSRVWCRRSPILSPTRPSRGCSPT